MTIEIRESSTIIGVKTVPLAVVQDERGTFQETFRKEWFPEREWKNVQSNRSVSKKGVLRGLHYHRNQVDYWYPISGRIRVGLYDLRRGSSTRGAIEVLEMTADDPVGLFVPVGVAHGFLALTDASLAYLVDNYYDGSDEHGVAWDDPEIGIEWRVEDPIVSPRDLANPLLCDLPDDALPG
jgi:dTDP-4-dehydrorhamnose 3,5-epimerase